MRTATFRLEVSARRIAAAEGNVRAYALTPVNGAAGAVSVRSAPATRPIMISSPAWLAVADTTDPLSSPDAIVEVVSAEHDFRANAQTFAAAQDMVRRLFDMLD